MARILFDLPERFGFTTELQVYISHVNYGGHLDNAQLLSLVSEARMRFFQSLGYTEGDVAGLAIVVGDMLAQYKSEAFHGETLRVQMTPRDFNRYGCDLVFCMTEVSSGRGGSRQDRRGPHRPRGTQAGAHSGCRAQGPGGRGDTLTRVRFSFAPTGQYQPARRRARRGMPAREWTGGAT